MKKVILIKYGELTTKKGNRNFFINTLKKNITKRLIDYNITIESDYYRMFIHANEEDISLVVDELKNIFGIHEIVVAHVLEDRDPKSIKENVLNILKELSFKTFKIETNRSDKTFEISSLELSKLVGAHILKNISGLKVDVKNPEMLVNIEIRKESIYISTSGIKALGGYPVGTLGKALLMLSGGIDSPVAGYLSLKRGVKLDYIYFESRPHTSIEARNKVISLAKQIEKYSSNSKLYIVNFTKVQEAIYKNLNEAYLITLMRRAMYKIAHKQATKIGALAIINGESIGQVASQTLSSMLVVNEVTNFPILRPLCSFDKQEIIEISKKIGTYETSILPYEDCCTVFVPKHPSINPSLKTAKEEEAKINLEELINEAIDNIEIIDLNKISAQNEEYL